MSTTIDQNVVEMRFDNSHFEKNVSTTMSTLDKLKQKLHLDGASKGLEDVGSAAKKVDMSGLGNGIEAVRMKFSALQVMGVTALTNITNSAVNAGKRIASALTIEPVKTGFSEYELKMDSVRTIMASTGESIDTVNGYLEELNKYSDQTIYSFSDMTQNIGKFTNAGVKLEDAVLAIKGISNEAALSGANANEAARAMYNFAQALSVGYIQRIDWKSIELANMATVEFKEQLLEAAIAAGTVKKKADGMYATLAHPDEAYNAAAMFTETLDDQWLTTEVLINTLSDYADETTDIGERAYAAAQDVTKLTQMFDILKETAQSGWAKTWELLFGNLEEAKEFFTPITETLQNVITTFSDGLNGVLGGALDSNWDKLISKINGAGVETSKYEEKIREVAKTHGISSKKIDELIKKHGSLKKAVQKGAISSKILKEALDELGIGTSESKTELAEFVEGLEKIQKILGWGSVGDDVKALQTALEELGYTVGKCGIDGIIGPDTTVAIKEFQQAAGIAVDGIAGPETLAALKEAGTSVKEISKDTKETSESYSELVDNITQKGGRTLLLESVQNILDAIGKVLTTIGEAWRNTFDPVTSDDILKIINKINELTESLIMSEESADNFKKIFEGLFALFQIGNSMFSMSLTAGLKILTAVLDLCGTNLVEVATYIADWIIKVRDWIKENTIFIGHIDKIAQIITTLITGIKSCIDEFLKLEVVQYAISRFGEIFTNVFKSIDGALGDFSIKGICDKINTVITRIKDWIKSLDKSKEAGKNIIDGLAEGLENGLKWIINIIKNIASGLITAFCSILGIESPSTVFITLGGFIIAGLLLGLLTNAPEIWETIKMIGGQLMANFGDSIGAGLSGVWTAIKNVFGYLWTSITTFVKDRGIDFGALTAAGIGVGLMVLVERILKLVTSTSGRLLNILDGLVAPLKGLGKMFNGLGSMFDDIGEARKMKAQATLILSMAIAIGILALSVSKLAQVAETGRLWEAIGAVAVLVVLVGLLGALAIGLDKMSSLMNKAGEDGSSLKTTLLIVGLAGAMLILAFAVEKLAKIGDEDLSASLKILAGMVLGLAAISLALSALMKSSGSVAKVGSMLLGLSVALIIAIGAVKLAGSLKPRVVNRGILVVGALCLLFAAIITASSIAGQYASRAGSMLLKMSITMLIMIGVIKLASMLSADEVERGLGVVTLVGVLFTALIAVSNLAGVNAGKAGAMILSISIAFVIMVGAIKLIAGISNGDIVRGLAIVLGIGVLFAALIAVSMFAGRHAAGAGLMLLMVSVTLVVLTGVLFLVGEIAKYNPGGIAAATVIIIALGVLMGKLIATTKNIPEKPGGALITLTVMLVLLLTALIWLTYIPIENLLPAMAAVAAVLLALSLVIHTTKSLQNAKPGPMLLVAGLVALLCGVLIALSQMEVKNDLLSTCTALSIVMVALAATLAIINRIDSKGIGTKITALTLMVVPLMAFTAALAFMPKFPAHVADQLKMLVPLLATMTLLLAGLSAIGKLAGWSSLIGVLALTAMVVPLAAFTAALAFMPTFPAHVAAQLDLLLPVLLAMTALLIPLALIGALCGWTALIGIVALTAMVVPLCEFGKALAEMPIIPTWVSDQIMLLVNVMVAMTLLLVPLTLIGMLGVWNSVMGIMGLIAMTVPLCEFGKALAEMPVIPAHVSDQIMLLVNVMVAMTLLLIPLTLIGFMASGAIGGVLALTAMVVPLVVFGKALAKMPDLSGAQTNVDILVDLMVSLTTLLVPLTLIGFLAYGAIGGVVALTAMIVPLLTFAHFLPKIAALGDLRAAVTNVDILVDLMVSLTTLLVPLTLIGALGPAAFVGIAALETLALLIAEVGVVVTAIGWLMEQCPSIEDWIDNGLGLFIKLAEGLGEMISAFGVGATSGLAEMGTNLSDFANNARTFIEVMSGDLLPVIAGAGNLAIAIGALLQAEWWDKISSWLPGGGGETKSPLANLGDEVAGFVKALDGVEISPEMATAVKHLCDALAVIATTPLDSAQLSSFGTAAATFAECIEEAAISLSGITDTDVENVKRAAEAGTAMADLEAAIPKKGGSWQEFAGTSDLAAFGESCVAFGDALIQYSAKVSEGNINCDAIQKSATAAQSLVDLADALPTIGGYWQAFAGEKNLGDFGETIVEFGAYLVDYSSIVSAGTINVEAIKASAEAASALVDVANALPKQGLLQEIFGEKDMADFGNSLVPFAEGLASYCTVAKSFEDIEDEVTAIQNTGTLVDELKGVMEKLNTTSWFTQIFGEKDGQGFGEALSSMAAGISSYCDMAKAFGDIEDEKLAIQNTRTLVQELAKIVDEDVGTYVDSSTTQQLVVAIGHLKTVADTANALTTGGYDYSGLTALKTNVIDKLNAMASGESAIDSASIYTAFDKLYTAACNAKQIAVELVTLNGYNYAGIDTFKEALTNLAGAEVDGAISALSGKSGSMSTAINDLISAMTTAMTNGVSSANSTMGTLVDGVVSTINGKKTDFNDAGKDLSTNLVNGLKSEDIDVKGAGSDVAGKAVSGASSKATGKGSMESAGKDLGNGLISGIEAKETAVYWAGYALGQKAVEGEKDGQKSNSPSKLTIQAGKWIGDGLIIGMGKMGNKVYKAGSTLGETATRTISSSISSIASAINTDIDSQPTIRPVLDLSDVRSGANTLSNMLDMDSRVGVLANVSSISSMMSSRGQNGVNDDVVSAIDKLRKDLGNVGNTTYSINGINFNDNSEVADAFKTIVRVARHERRV